MKIGPRKPSIKKSVKARTTGKVKRTINKSINPTYGKKGIGYIKSPEKAIKNKIYHQTTFNIFSVFKGKHAELILESGNVVIVKNKNEAQFYAQQFLKHCYESTEIVNKTCEPHIFFERYALLISETEKLVQLEKIMKFKGEQPSATLQRLINSKEEQTNIMINRSYEKLSQNIMNLKTIAGKKNAILHQFEKFKIYFNEMTNSNINLIETTHNAFLSKYITT